MLRRRYCNFRCKSIGLQANTIYMSIPSCNGFIGTLGYCKTVRDSPLSRDSQSPGARENLQIN